MTKTKSNRKDNRIRLSRFGCVTGLIFGTNGGSTEVALAPLEITRLLTVWEEYECAKKSPDERVITALKLLISKARTVAPGFVVEV